MPLIIVLLIASLIIPEPITLTLEDEVEIQITPPEDWFVSDVTDRYPAYYFSQDNLQTLTPAQKPAGAIVQISLLDQRQLARTFEDAMPEEGDLAGSYAELMVNGAIQGISGSGEETVFHEYPAYRVEAIYPPELTMHSNGTTQETLFVEIEGNLLIVTIYAPTSEWAELQEVWQNMLESVLIMEE